MFKPLSSERIFGAFSVHVNVLVKSMVDSKGNSCAAEHRAQNSVVDCAQIAKSTPLSRVKTVTRKAIAIAGLLSVYLRGKKNQAN